MDYKEYIDKLQAEVDILKRISKFDDIKDRIYIRLMNPLINRKTIDQLESVPFLDLTVTFVLDMRCSEGSGSERQYNERAGNKKRDSEGGSMIRITKNLAESWGVCGSELLEIALENERRSTRFFSEELINTLKRMCRREPVLIEELNRMEAENKGPDRLIIYALYEESFINGSAALLRNEILRSVAEKAEGDILIIPSSVNELICVADRPDMDFAWLRSVVEEVNDTVVPDDEILSYSVYRYSVRDDCVSVAA